MKRINPYKKYNGSFIPEWLLPRDEISAGAKLCFARLARFAGQNGKAYPKIETLANALGVSKRQCSNYLKELKEVNLIESEQQGLGQPNIYYFLDHKWQNCRLNNSDRMKDTSLQGGSKVHDRDEENCTTGMKDTSSPIDKESHDKESHDKESVVNRLKKAESIQVLFDIWLEYRKQKNKFSTLYEKETLEHKLTQWGVSKSKKIIQIAMQNGWLSLKEDYVKDNENNKSPFRPNSIHI